MAIASGQVSKMRPSSRLQPVSAIQAANAGLWRRKKSVSTGL